MPLVKVEDRHNDTLLNYGGWGFYVLPRLSGGGGAGTDRKGLAATFSFTGTGVVWKTVKHPFAGRTDVYLDGTKVKTFDGFSPDDQFNVTGYQRTRLQNRRHTLRLVNAGTKNAASEGTFTDVDRLVVAGQSFEHTSARIAYGPWRGVSNANASDGTYRVSTNKTVPLILGPVYGPHFDLVTVTGPDFGKALVEVYEAYSVLELAKGGQFGA